jgi:hypothetical protein
MKVVAGLDLCDWIVNVQSSTDDRRGDALFVDGLDILTGDLPRDTVRTSEPSSVKELLLCHSAIDIVDEPNEMPFSFLDALPTSRTRRVWPAKAPVLLWAAAHTLHKFSTHDAQWFVAIAASLHPQKEETRTKESCSNDALSISKLTSPAYPSRPSSCP